MQHTLQKCSEPDPHYTEDLLSVVLGLKKEKRKHSYPTNKQLNIPNPATAL